MRPFRQRYAPHVERLEPRHLLAVSVLNINDQPSGSLDRVDDMTLVDDKLVFIGKEYGHPSVYSYHQDSGTTLLRRFDSASARFQTWGDRPLFSAGDRSSGTSATRIWSTDGTPQGTVPRVTGGVRHVSVGDAIFYAVDSDFWVSRDGADELVTSIDAEFESIIYAAEDRMFFKARDAAHGEELWTSDGTADGTRIVRDITVGEASSNIRDITTVGGRLYFTIQDSKGDRSLWTSDGTEVGTQSLASIGDQFGQPILTPIDETLFFSYYDENRIRHLWATHGSGADTLEVLALANRSLSSQPQSHDDGVTWLIIDQGQRQLWKADADGSNARVFALVSFSDIPGRFSSLHTTSDTIFAWFESDDIDREQEPFDDLWRISLDGEHEYLGRFRENFYQSPETMAGKDELFFIAVPSDRDLFSVGSQMWRSDGTPDGTVMISAITNGDSRPARLTPAEDGVYFSADDGIHGRELWKSNGTRDGTYLVHDTYPGHEGSATIQRDSLAVDDLGRAFYSADDSEHGRELWVSNGLEDGTHLVKDIRPVDQEPSWTNLAGIFESSSDHVYFDVVTPAIYSSDGTEAGTVPIFSGQLVRSFSLDDGTVVLAAVYPFALPHRYSILHSDGTVAGTSTIANLAAMGRPWGRIRSVVAVDGYVYFLTYEQFIPSDAGRAELWRVELTGGQPELVQSFGEYVYFVGGLFAVNDRVIVDARGRHNNEDDLQEPLWTTDGTAHGTTLLTDDTIGITRINEGQLHFTTPDGRDWRSDGTLAGTERYTDGLPEKWDSLTLPTTIGDFEYVFAGQGDILYGKMALWKINASTREATLVVDLPQTLHGFRTTNHGWQTPAVSSGVLYFSWYDVEHGIELWSVTNDDATVVQQADWNDDSELNCEDLVVLADAIDNDLYKEQFDLFGDGELNAFDRDQWLLLAGQHVTGAGERFSSADANLDGMVDAADFDAWFIHRFSARDSVCGGDFTGDGLVDVRDFNAWNDERFTKPAAASTSVHPGTPRAPAAFTWVVLDTNVQQAAKRLGYKGTCSHEKVENPTGHERDMLHDGLRKRHRTVKLHDSLLRRTRTLKATDFASFDIVFEEFDLVSALLE